MGQRVPLIFLNKDVPTDRKRLTAAHELGHLVLHRYDMGSDPEDEANAFAAEFLMPLDVIKPQLRNLDIPRLANLKLQWGVSMAAIIERAFRSGLMGKDQRTQLYKRFSLLGYRKVEPGSAQLPPETPALTAAIHNTLLEARLEELRRALEAADEAKRVVGVNMHRVVRWLRTTQDGNEQLSQALGATLHDLLERAEGKANKSLEDTVAAHLHDMRGDLSG